MNLDALLTYQKADLAYKKLNDEIKFQTIRMLLFSRIVRALPSQKAPTDGEINSEKKLNGPCPCGSGKKYKNCCYKKALAAQAGQNGGQAAGVNAPSRPLTKQEEYALKRQQRKENKQNGNK